MVDYSMHVDQGLVVRAVFPAMKSTDDKQITRRKRFWRWFYELLRYPVWGYFRLVYSLKAENRHIPKEHRGPAFIIPNHVTTIDPFLVGVFFPTPIVWVASDANFRKKMLAFLLGLVGTIPIAKLMGDTSTIKDMMSTLKSGKAVGLFAEGERTWDGVTQPLLPATYKLIRIAKVPVIVPIIKGGYMAMPRWCFKSRRGPIIIEFRQALSADEASTFSLKQIEERINTELNYDEQVFIQENPLTYTSRTMAEPLELVLYRCQVCSSYQTITSRLHTCTCGSCNTRWTFSSGNPMMLIPQSQLQLQSESQPQPPISLKRWLQEQRVGLWEDLNQATEDQEIFADSIVEYQTGYRDEKMVNRGKTRVGVVGKGILLGNSVFSWSEIRGLNVVYQNQVDFYVGQTLYTLHLGRSSGFKYMEAYQIMTSGG